MNKLLMKSRLIISCIAMMIAMLILPFGLNARAESADGVTEYTVTFVANDGGFYDADGNYAGSKTITVKAGEPVGYVPDPYNSANGFLFTGWYLDSDLRDVVTNIYEYVPTDNMTLYAGFREVDADNDPHINLDFNGGKSSYGTQYIEVDAANGIWYINPGKSFDSIGAPTAVRNGFALSGWYKDADCTEKVESSTVLKNDDTIYAGWTRDYYTLTIDAGDEGYFERDENNKTISWNLSVGVSQYLGAFLDGRNNTYTNEGKIITGWYEDSELTKEVTLVNGVYTPTDDVTLYAKWEQGIKVTFDYTIASDEYKSDEYIHTSYQKEGKQLSGGQDMQGKTFGEYVFDGWYLDEECSSRYVSSIYDYTVVEEVTFYAKWSKSVAVTYDAGDGHFYDGEISKTVYIPEGEYIQIGYTAYNNDKSKAFAGWALNKGETSADNAIEKDLIAPDRAMTLYAIYTDGYQITFDGNGGVISFFKEYNEDYWTSRTVDSEEFTLTLPTNISAKSYDYFWAHEVDAYLPDNSGKHLFGWSTSKSPEDVIDFETYKFNSDQTLYAIWGDECKVTLDANGGHFSSDKLIIETIAAGKHLPYNYPVSIDDPEKEFKSWNTEKDGSGENYEDLHDYVAHGDAVLYAQWQDAWTITFDANGGYFVDLGSDVDKIYVDKVLRGEEKYAVGSYHAKNADSYKALVGWSTDPEGRNIFVNAEHSFTPTKSMTLYAVWKDGYKVRYHANAAGGYFNYNGVSVTEYEMTVPQGESIHSSPVPQLVNNDDNYIFSSYNTKADGSGDDIDYNNALTGDIDLYAQWEKGYNIVYNANGGYFFDNVSQTEYETEIKENEPLIFFPKVRNDAYGLVGWNTSKDGKGKEVTADMKVTSNMTVYAIWAEGYKVTINAGKGKVNRYGNIGIVNTYSENVAKGKEILLPIREEVIWSDEGYIYGWYEDENFQKPIYIINSDNEAYYYSYYPTKDITLYAKFVSGEDKVKVTGVALNKTKATIGAGDSLELNAVIKPSNATNNAVSFTSSNADVATVDETGKVVAVAAGKADITVTTEDGKFTAKCYITVDGQNTEKISSDLENLKTQLQNNVSKDQIEKTVNDTLSSMGSAEAMAAKVESNDTVAGKLQELEAVYTAVAHVEVVNPADDDATKNALKEVFGNEVNTTVASVSGAGLNAAPDQVAKLDITPIAEDDKKDVKKEGFNSVAQIDMTLKVEDTVEGSTEMHELVAPITITLPLPKTINRSKLYVLHYYSDGSYDLIKPVLSNNSMTITVWRFSTFAIVEVADGEAVNSGNNNDNQNNTPNPGTVGNGGQTQSGNGNQNSDGNNTQNPEGNGGQPQSGNGDQNSDGNNTQNPGSGNDEQSQNPGTGNGEQSQNPGTGNDGQSQNPGTGNSGQSQGGSGNQNTGNTSGTGNNAQNPTGNGANSGNTGAQTPVENQEGNVNAGDNGGQSQNGFDDKTSSGADVTAIPETTDNSVKEVDDPTKAKITSNKEEISVSKIKKKDQKVTVKVERSKGKITVKNVSSKKLKKYLTVKVKGKKVICTVKKGAPKGTYKVKITVAKKGKIKKTTKTIEIVVK